MKTIGILGGLGPQATMDFEARIHAVSHELLPQSANGNYPPMVVYYFRHAPTLRAQDGALQPNPRLLEAAKKLGTWADFLVIPSNAPHRFRQEIEQASGRTIISMIDATLKEVQKRQLKRVGIVGLGVPEVYQIPLGQLGLAYECLAEALRARLDQAIFALMRGQDGREERAIAREAIASLRAKGVDGIILGRTEILLLLKEEANAPDLINPGQLLAEAAVRYAME